MGGNAIQGCIRLNRKEFEKVESHVASILASSFDQALPTIFYESKESFGDLDVIIASEGINKSILETFLFENFGAKYFYHNGNVSSFGYKLPSGEYFQVDFIFVKPEEFESAYFYYSYNDLNNLVGRIAHKFGLSFGWKGLRYHIRNESGHKVKTLTISTDERRIYEFLGLDYDVYEKGFNDVEDIYNFVVSSNYFDKDIFSYENLNHTNKARNRKRSTYHGFLEWMESNKVDKTYAFKRDKSSYLLKIASYFPESKIFEYMAESAGEMRNNRLLASKFNGNIVMDLTGLQGKELGMFMSGFKAEYDVNSLDDVNKAVLEYYQLFEKEVK